MRPGAGQPGRRGANRRLASRLFAAQALIVAAGAVTLVIVAVVIAPGLFRDHLRRAIGPIPGELARHLEEALAGALLISLGVAVVAALATTLAVSWVITRRLTRPVAAMAVAAARIADGRYETRVPPSGLGVEFATLDNSFNRMAAALQHTEQRRQHLLSDLAHELRTPLATLDSFLEGIQDGVIPVGETTWQTMREQTARMRRLVDDVDAVSRAEERQLNLRRERLHPDDLVDEAVRAAASAFAAKGVRLTRRAGAEPVPVDAHPEPAPIDVGAEPVLVDADPDRVREILDNLLGNALRHTPAGGEVTVAVEAGTAAATGTAEVRIDVADSGEGVAAEHLPHLFDRFYRADPARSRSTGGSGIGLTIARALARAHDGDLRVYSDGRGHGATFTLTLPAAPADRPPAADRPLTGRRPATGAAQLR